jgi:hypothetical protein
VANSVRPKTTGGLAEVTIAVLVPPTSIPIQTFSFMISTKLLQLEL